MIVDWDDPLFDSKLHSILKFELPLANRKIKSKNSECFITLSYEWAEELDEVSIVAILLNASCSYCGIETQYTIKREDLIARKDFAKKSCFIFYCEHCPQIYLYDTRFSSNNKFSFLRTKQFRIEKPPEHVLKPSFELKGGSSKSDKVGKRLVLSQPEISEERAPDFTDIIEGIEALSISIDDISHDDVLMYAKRLRKDWFNIVQLIKEMRSSRLFLKYRKNFAFEENIIQGQLEESLQYLTKKEYLERRISNNIELFRITPHGLKHSRFLDIVVLELNFQDGQNINDSKVLQIKTKINPDDILQYLKAKLRGKRSKKITFNQIKNELRLANIFKTHATRRRTLIIDFLRKRNNSSKSLVNDLENKIKSIHDEHLTSRISHGIDILMEKKYIKPIGDALQLTSRFQWLIIYIQQLLKGDLPFYFQIFVCLSFLFLLISSFLIFST